MNITAITQISNSLFAKTPFPTYSPTPIQTIKVQDGISVIVYAGGTNSTVSMLELQVQDAAYQLVNYGTIGGAIAKLNDRTLPVERIDTIYKVEMRGHYRGVSGVFRVVRKRKLDDFIITGVINGFYPSRKEQQISMIPPEYWWTLVNPEWFKTLQVHDLINTQ